MEFLISLCLPVIPPVSRQAFREYPPILFVYVSPLIRFPSCLQPARHLEKFLFHGKESCYSPHLPRPTDSTHAPHVDIGQECKQCCANRERDERTLFFKKRKTYDFTIHFVNLQNILLQSLFYCCETALIFICSTCKLLPHLKCHGLCCGLPFIFVSVTSQK